MDIIRSFVALSVWLGVSVSVNASVIANFSVSGLDGSYDVSDAFVSSGNGGYSGTAILTDTGLLTLNGTLNTFVPSSETGNLGDISTSITSQMQFTGTLTGSVFSGISILSYSTTNCVDTGSTGIFAGDACANLLEPSIFSIFTDPTIFNLNIGGQTVIDWNGSSSAVGQLTAQQSVSRTTFTTVPIPAGLWLLMSSLCSLLLAKLKTHKG